MDIVNIEYTSHDYNITLLRNLCKTHRTRGQQINRQKVIQLYVEKHPEASSAYLSKLIDKHCGDIIQQDPRTIHPQYAEFLVTCMTSLQQDPQSPYRVRGRGKQKVNNTRINQEFYEKFPEAEVAPGKIKRKCGEIRKALSISLQELPE